MKKRSLEQIHGKTLLCIFDKKECTPKIFGNIIERVERGSTFPRQVFVFPCPSPYTYA
jgi:hypothetical protein